MGVDYNGSSEAFDRRNPVWDASKRGYSVAMRLGCHVNHVTDDS